MNNEEKKELTTDDLNTIYNYINKIDPDSKVFKESKRLFEISKKYKETHNIDEYNKLYEDLDKTLKNN